MRTKFLKIPKLLLKLKVKPILQKPTVKVKQPLI